MVQIYTIRNKHNRMGIAHNMYNPIGKNIYSSKFHIHAHFNKIFPNSVAYTYFCTCDICKCCILGTLKSNE